MKKIKTWIIFLSILLSGWSFASPPYWRYADGEINTGQIFIAYNNKVAPAMHFMCSISDGVQIRFIMPTDLKESQQLSVLYQLGDSYVSGAQVPGTVRDNYIDFTINRLNRTAQDRIKVASKVKVQFKPLNALEYESHTVSLSGGGLKKIGWAIRNCEDYQNKRISGVLFR